MNEFENGFHNENLENNRINNQENNSQQVAIDVTPIEESVTQENTESHRYSYREQGTGGSSYQYDNGNNSNDTYNNSYSSHGWRDESTYNNENYYGNIPPEPDKRRRQRKNGSKNNKNGMGKKAAKLVASAAVFGLVAGACFVGVSVAKDKLYPSTADRIETTSGTTSAKSETSSSGSSSSSSNVASVVNEVMPSVVSITSTIQSSNYYGFGTQESEGAGSGFIVAKTKDNLMIATNNHVVSDATSLTVGFADDTTAKATVVGTDSSADLAVISVKIKDIKDSTASKIKVATLGSSDDLKVGEEVVAIGNALGYGQSVTTGVVSAKNREVSLTDGTMNLLQTDAAINPGNSGGVLINMDGQVVGINNAKLEDTSVEGMGYAIPITTAKTILTDLMNASSVSTKDAAFLGVVGRDINESYSSALGIPSGIYVSQVVSGSPAEKAGISAGDVITKFEGNNVSTMSGLKEKLALKKANTKVKITFKRANQSGTYEEKTVTVTLGKKSDFSDVTTDNSSDSSNDSNNNSNNGNNNGNSNGNSGNSNGNSGDYGYGNGNFGNDNGNGYINPYEYFFGNFISNFRLSA
ncbi:MAG: trypsin-like peptidase domain-containing protein [Anaerobutyricum hallii]|uniref:S1C family serine protease n=1 Tax=Anaerobutyricum hallii TaxID=39488 RepID=UPI001E15A592|nr:trypsin-like peptidase domain-containing protein [Anaerobutyricum hallii]MBS7167101.1 trypsin-like peptidase domain-containing protein [Anaerobutyricum hallii]